MTKMVVDSFHVMSHLSYASTSLVFEVYFRCFFVKFQTHVVVMTNILLKSQE